MKLPNSPPSATLSYDGYAVRKPPFAQSSLPLLLMIFFTTILLLIPRRRKKNSIKKTFEYLLSHLLARRLTELAQIVDARPLG